MYLITHGEMLENRLRDQIREFRRLVEDPKKTEVLRLVSLANALGAPVLVDRILDAVPLRDDPQDVVGSLVGEYVALDDRRLGALHWVRSEHVARILHEGGVPSVTATALATTALVPEASLPFLVANAMRWGGVDRSAFLAGLAERFRDARTASLLLVLDGLFESGERDLFALNRDRFQEAYDLIGSSGLLMVHSKISPVLAVDMLQIALDLFRDRAGAFPQLREIADRFVEAPRGLDRVREFLKVVVPARPLRHLESASGDIGRLLDWCALAGVEIPAWLDVRSHLVAGRARFSLPGDEIASFAQGLFRYDRAAYDMWFERHREDLLPCIQLHADCLTLDLVEPSSVLTTELSAPVTEMADGDAVHAQLDESTIQSTLEERQRARADAEKHGIPLMDVEITFVVKGGGSERPLDQAVDRLKLLRQVLPAAGRYISHGEYMFPAGLTPPVDDTQKRIPRWYLPFPSDVRKNIVWGGIVEAEFYADTHYRLQEHWYQVRTLALRIAEGLAKIITRFLQNRDPDVRREFGPGEDPVRELEMLIPLIPRTGGHSFERLWGTVPEPLRNEDLRGAPDSWISWFQSFRRELWEYTNGLDADVGRRVVFNFREAEEKLAGMHAFFAALFRESPDYFGARELDAPEREVYRNLKLLLEGFITDRLGYFTRRPLEELRRQETQREQEEIARLAAALKSIPGIVLPKGIKQKAWLRTTVIGVPVSEPLQPQSELLEVAGALTAAADAVDWFWFVPLKDGARVGSSGYQLSARHLRNDELDDRAHNSAVLGLVLPSELPPEIDALLPDLATVDAPPPPLGLQLVGLRAATDMLLERRRVVDQILAPGEHPCRRELHARHRAAMGEFDEEQHRAIGRVRSVIGELETHVDAEVADSRRTTARINEFLGVLETVIGDWSADPSVLDGWDEISIRRIAQDLEAEIQVGRS